MMRSGPRALTTLGARPFPIRCTRCWWGRQASNAVAYLCSVPLRRPRRAAAIRHPPSPIHHHSPSVIDDPTQPVPALDPCPPGLPLSAIAIAMFFSLPVSC